VAALWRYPVKSMMGEELNYAEVNARGLLGDRQFAVVDRATGKVGGVKNPRKRGNFFDSRAAMPSHRRPGHRCPRFGSRCATAHTTAQAGTQQVLSRAFGREVTLRKRSPWTGRGPLPPKSTGPTCPVSTTATRSPTSRSAGTFFDIAVMHLLTTATIDRLRALYPRGRFEARRFRPNVVISTPGDDDGFAENDWVGRTVTIGDNVTLAITEKCPRCVMITLPQGDLPRDSGILRTAAQHNAVPSASTPRC
jgi:uncharacterized protein